MVQLSDEVERYTDHDVINVFDVLQPLSSVKKRQYQIQGAPILGRGSYGTVIHAIWYCPFHCSETKQTALKIISKEPPGYIQREIPEHPPPSREGKSREEYQIEKQQAKVERNEAIQKWDRARSIHKLRVRNEIAILGEISHENIVKFYDCFESRANFYISTELLYGEELYDRLLRLKYFRENDARKDTRSILEGVAYLHSKDVIHMDLRPENIRYRDIRRSSELVIIDLGFARKFDETRDLGYPTTGLYVAPEILYRMKYGAPITCQPSADIWSVGVIVHLMLTGVYPFASGKGDDADQVYCDNVIYGGSVDYNGEHWSNVSNTAKEFMRSLLHKSRRKRTTASLALDHEWLNATFVPSQDAHHSAQRRNAQRRRTDHQASNRAAGGLQDEAHRPNPDRTRARPVRNSNVTSSRRERGALHQNENGEPQRKRRSSMFSFFGRLSKSREKDKEDTGEGKEGSSGHRQHRKLPKKSWSRG